MKPYCPPGTKYCRVHEVCHPLDQFYRDKTSSDGLMNFCISEMRRRQEVRRSTGALGAQIKRYNASPKGKYRQRARNAVKTALRQGQLYKPEHCQFGDALKFNGLTIVVKGVKIEECLVTKISAHHYLGYDPKHWTSVIWLCDKHHAICETEEQ